MTTRHDPAAPLEPLTPQEREWAARLALIGPHDGPPPALDAKILAAAHAAVAQRPARRSRRPRWPMLVGAAASLVIVVGLAWQLQPLLRFRPSLGEGPAADAPMAASEGSLSDDVLAAADPVAQTATTSPPPAPTTTPNKSLRPPRAVSEARRSPTPASAPAPAAREFGDDAIPPYTDYAGMAAARQAASQSAANHATARVAPDDRRARAAAAAPQAFPSTRTDTAEAIARPAPPPVAVPAAPPAIGASDAAAPMRDASARKATASPPPAAAGEQDNAILERVEVTGSRIAKAFPAVREDARLEPAAWLQRIRDRRDANDLAGARESLALFRQHYPRIRLPADLARPGL